MTSRSNLIIISTWRRAKKDYVAMHAIHREYTIIINGITQFTIPVFQRDYTWKELNCEQLWKDVLHVAHAM